jgi:putative ABC transport system permease protein
VTPNLFATLGVRSALGRLFEPTDGSTPLVVLSHRVWQSRFGADPTIVGRTVVLNEMPQMVIGITRPEFYFPTRDVELWTLFALPRSILTQEGNRQSYTGSALARLKRGISISAAAAEATTRSRAAAGAPGSTPEAGVPRVELRSLQDSVIGNVKPALTVLMAAVLTVLALASANVSGLLLVRSMARRRELALRAALGATAARIARGLLVESLTLGAVAGAAGLLGAWWLQAALPLLMPDSFPRLDDIVIDWRVLAFGLIVSLGTGLLCGMAPAIQGARMDLVSALSGGVPSGPGASARGFRWRTLVLGGEVALSCALVVMAALLARSFVNLVTTDPGYRTRGVLTAQLALQPGMPGPEQQGLINNLIARLEALPGVRYAGITNTLPLTPERVVTSARPKGDARPDRSIPVRMRIVTPGYLQAMGMRIVNGRAFDSTDAAGRPDVAMANEAFVRQYGYTVGDALNDKGPNDKGPTLIGVLADVHAQGQDKPAEPELYGSFLQMSGAPAFVFLDRVHLAVATEGDPVAFVPTLRAIAREVSPNQPIYDIMTTGERVDRSVATPRFFAVALGTFSVIALVMAAVGLYGAIAHTVTQRRREIGIRMALGADAPATLALVVGQGLAPAWGGIAVGLVIAAAASGAIESMLFGVTPLDPWALISAAVVLLLVALLACLVPARQALRVDAVATLKAE